MRRDHRLLSSERSLRNWDTRKKEEIANDIASACKAVHFNTRVKVCVIPTTSSYSQSEMEACWPTGEEEGDRKREIIKTIRIFHQNDGKIPSDLKDDFTCRGLEGLTCLTANTRKQKRRSNRKNVAPQRLKSTASRRIVHTDAVLDEQDLQLMCNYKQVEERHAAIARISIRHSKLSRYEAQARGDEDASFVRHSDCKVSLSDIYY